MSKMRKKVIAEREERFGSKEEITMLSEKSYWILLISLFSGSAILIWLLLIPQRVVDYDLGVNFFTSSIFMILTIVFLSWLSRLREEHQWESARNQLHGELGVRLFSILMQILFMIDQVLVEDNQKAYAVRRLEELSVKSNEEFREILFIPLNNLGEEAFSYIGSWAKRDKHLISMEMQSFQSFFDPDLRVHMLNIVCALSDLEYLLEVREKEYVLEEKDRKTIAHITDHKINIEKIPDYLHIIVKEIREIKNMGIEISR